jgi:hypothetical protein
MRELGLFVVAMAVWFVLARWVLPYFGVATCCGGACQVAPSAEPGHKAAEKETQQ